MKRTLLLNQIPVELEVHSCKDKDVSFNWNGMTYSFELIHETAHSLVLRDKEGKQIHLSRDFVGASLFLSAQGFEAELSEGGGVKKKKATLLGGLNAPMPGKVFKVLVQVGDKVTKGQTLLILEAMKMEHAIKADKDGEVKSLFFKEGDLVQSGMALAEIK